MSEEEDLGNVRENKLRERLEQAQKAQQVEEQLKSVLKNLVDVKAYERLMNVRLSNPHLFEQVSSLLVYLSRNKQLNGKLSDEKLKQLLVKLTERKETTIEFKRK